jgi:hypothetical protein
MGWERERRLRSTTLAGTLAGIDGTAGLAPIVVDVLIRIIDVDVDLTTRRSILGLIIVPTAGIHTLSDAIFEKRGERLLATIDPA